MTRPHSVLAMLLAAAMVLVNGIGLAHSLRLEIAGPHGVVWSRPIAAGEPFEVAFVHSQERTPFDQHYIARRAGLIEQDSVRFGSYGAGMPMTAVVISDSSFVAAVERRLTAVRMLSSHAARLRLRYRGRELRIDQWFDDYEPFEIRIR